MTYIFIYEKIPARFTGLMMTRNSTHLADFLVVIGCQALQLTQKIFTQFQWLPATKKQKTKRTSDKDSDILKMKHVFQVGCVVDVVLNKKMYDRSHPGTSRFSADVVRKAFDPIYLWSNQCPSKLAKFAHGSTTRVIFWDVPKKPSPVLNTFPKRELIIRKLLADLSSWWFCFLECCNHVIYMYHAAASPPLYDDELLPSKFPQMFFMLSNWNVKSRTLSPLCLCRPILHSP